MLGQLDGIGNVLPDQELFLYMYIRKEAVLSSQIEGTQSSLSDLLMFENKKEVPGVPEHDVMGGTRPGNAKFVPPPPEKVMELLGDLELFLHDDKSFLPVLVKAALAHVQFETIYPFLDGNGRLGRLLITFILCVEGVLSKPLLYLSLYFKTHREQYYDYLQSVRETGDWESWIKFFLEGVIETANQAVETAKKIIQLFSEDR